MIDSLALQYVVVALAVLASAFVVAKKQFPGALRRARVALALPLVREGRPGWLRAIGARLAPPSVASGDACGGCSDCGPPQDTLP